MSAKEYAVDVDTILTKLMSYFDVFTFVELANKLNVSQQTISAWRARQSVTAIEKKCKELKIHEYIFGSHTELQVLFDKAVTLSNKDRLTVLKDYLIKFIEDSQSMISIQNKIKTLKEQDFWNMLIGTSENLFELLIQALNNASTNNNFNDARQELIKLIQETKTGLDGLNPRVYTFNNDKVNLLDFVNSLDDIECLVILKNAPEIIKIIKQNRTWMNRF